MTSPSPFICSFAAEIVSKYTSAIHQEIDGVRKGEDMECTHRMRVASRRLRTALIIFKDCFPEKRLHDWNLSVKKIARTLTTVRDLDVQLDLLNSLESGPLNKKYQPGLTRLILRRSQQRKKIQDGVIKILGQFCQDHTVEKIQKTCDTLLSKPDRSPLSPDRTLYSLAAQSISNGIADVFAYEKFIYNVESIHELHQMRIAMKHLRYSAEIFLPLYETQFDQVNSFIQIIRKGQDILGSIHDCDIWIISLPDFIVDEKKRTLIYYGHTRPFNWLVPGINYLIENRQQERENLYRRFLFDWGDWKEAGIWNNFQQTIQRHII
jgi:CHAD domain-containing protein